MLVISEICHLKQFQGPLRTFQKKNPLRKSKFSQNTVENYLIDQKPGQWAKFSKTKLYPIGIYFYTIVPIYGSKCKKQMALNLH